MNAAFGKTNNLVQPSLNGKVQLNLAVLSRLSPSIFNSTLDRVETSFASVLAYRKHSSKFGFSPGYSHPQMLEDTVAAGKRVYCKKPMAVDTDGCYPDQTIHMIDTCN